MSITSRFTGTAFSIAGKIAPHRLPILIFHRVLPKTDPLFPHELNESQFDQLISFISKTFNVIKLGDAVECLNKNNLPVRPLVITFDDGYADNAEIAFPILNKYNIPATFFISTGFLDGGRMWNDTVIECIRRTTFSEIDLKRLDLPTVKLTTDELRRHAIHILLNKIKYMDLQEREDALNTLHQLTGNITLPDKLMMRSTQVRQIHNGGMEIGGHTINHPILSKIGTKDAEIEISGGKAALEEITKAPIRVFAYPNGKPNQDYCIEHVRLVEKLGFIAAVTTAKGICKPGNNLYQLPRYTPWGTSLAIWSARLFLNRLQSSFDIA